MQYKPIVITLVVSMIQNKHNCMSRIYDTTKFENQLELEQLGPVMIRSSYCASFHSRGKFSSIDKFFINLLGIQKKKSLSFVYVCADTAVYIPIYIYIL